MKKKFLNCIIIILIILSILFLVKFFQINTFLNKVQENFKITNFEFEILRTNDSNNIWSKTKYIAKDATLLIIPNEDIRIYITNNVTDHFSSIAIDEKNKIFYTSEYQTSEKLNLSGNFQSNYCFIEKVKLCFKWKIKYEKLNNLDCIVITDENNNTTYYNKKNAYIIKSDNWGEITNVKVNSVTDNDIKLPNLEKYTNKSN